MNIEKTSVGRTTDRKSNVREREEGEKERERETESRERQGNMSTTNQSDVKRQKQLSRRQGNFGKEKEKGRHVKCWRRKSMNVR